MSASLQVGAPPSLFTIEQIELVRRLRNSGMTKESIIEAYESFDRLEGELGNLFNIPRTTASTSALAQQPNQQTAPAGFVSPALTQSSSSNTPVIAGVSSLAAGGFVSAASNFSPSSTGAGNFGGSYAGFASPNANYTTTTSSGPSSAERASFANYGTGNFGATHFVGGSGKYFPANSEHAGFSSPKAAKRPKLDGMDAEDIGGGGLDQLEQGNFALAEDMVNELDAFLRKGFTAAVEEIRKYVCDHSIKQTQIAAQSKISQPYISRFLRGDGRDMSERSRCSIYLWYLRHKKGVFDSSSPSSSGGGGSSQESVRLPPASTLLQLSRGREGYTPESLGHNVTAVNLAVQQSPMSMDLSQMVPETVVKRERFTFRSIHREILEEYFAQQQYPNQEEREVLAKQCNEALQKFIGHELCDREMMTTTHVANWFNNRRKEIKRLAREEGISTSEVVLPTRSRSPLLRKHLAVLASATSSPASANSERAQPEDDASTFDSYVVIPADQDSPIEIKEEAED